MFKHIKKIAEQFEEFANKEYGEFPDRLFKHIYEDMVNAVYVHVPDKSSGHRIQDVEISYNYAGILPAALLYDLQNDETA